MHSTFHTYLAVEIRLDPLVDALWMMPFDIGVWAIFISVAANIFSQILRLKRFRFIQKFSLAFTN